MNSDLKFLGTRFKKKEQDLPKHAPVFLLTVATVDDRIPAHGSQADTLVTPTPRIYTYGNQHTTAQSELATQRLYLKVTSDKYGVAECNSKLIKGHASKTAHRLHFPMYRIQLIALIVRTVLCLSILARFRNY